MRLLSSVLLSLILLPAAPAAWKAGVAKVNITPTEPIWMSGYAARVHPSEGVYAPIYVKAVALEDDAGNKTVLVTGDLVGFTKFITDPVFEAARKRWGLSRERLAINASHTHSGPLAGQVDRPVYRLEDKYAVVVKRYTDKLIEDVIGVIGAALDDMAPAEVAFEQGYAGFAVNRRRVGHREYPGPTDHDVPVLTVRGADGKLRAVVFGYACHATVMNEYEIHGDYPGFAQAELERRFPGATALFMAGCGADQNPLPRRRMELTRMYGEILAEAVDQVVAGKMKPLGGTIQAIYATPRVHFQKAPTRAEIEARIPKLSAYEKRHSEYLLERLDQDGKLAEGYDYPIRVWRMGDALTWVTLGGEVVVDYGLQLKEALGPDTTWVSGYTDDVFAYIPTARIIDEGGYEGATSMLGYGWPAPFEPSIERTILERVKALARGFE
ncbi:MAG: hypothetical protein GC160_22380 [Acidobacteria bacterium]|nr:hypothetical protein [Acidobacteriota bacterium]